MKWLLYTTAALALFLAGCGQEAPQSKGPAPTYTEAPSTDYTGAGKQKTPAKVGFADVTAGAGISFRHQTGASGKKWMPETMGSGCALFDFDGDDRLDILLVNSAYWPGHAKANDRPTSKLYRNLGKGRFEDVTRQAGLDFVFYGMGAAAADYDADGDQDLFLTALGPNLLLRNDGGRFTDVAAQAGVQGSQWTDDQGGSHPEWSTAAAWVDVDGDGWLDLFVTHYVHWSPETDFFTTMDGKTKSYATPQQYPGSTCRLYRNTAKGRFAEVTKEAGLVLPDAKSLGVALADFDNDRDIDLVVTNDTQPNYLLRNLGQGRFQEVGLAAGIAYDEAGRARAGMGVDVASVKNDGVQAIAIGNFSREPVSLYQQTPEGVFIDGAGKSRLVQPTLPSLTFGLRFFDYDLDGYQDLVIANGHIEPEINVVQREITYEQAPQLFWNDGEGQFREVSQQTGGLFNQPIVARGLATGDFDGDGDPDLLVTTNGGPAYLLRNDGPTGKAVALHLRGGPPNRDAIGALVRAEAGDLKQEQLVRSGSSYLSHSAPALFFGLGDRPQVDRLSIRWPDGQTEELAGLKAGAEYWIAQGKGVSRTQPFAR
ncbi:MAG: CRTAC1 family protein [Candidatus Handelsmanbacteria bacterium]|nr:CRTAC1 family protein [Candidatus Handelsmanbacteria bacterium]